jgi:cation:H+ antiporter
LVGIILVLLVAHFTINLTVELLSDLPLSKFVVGILIFAIGTNFPEIIIAVRSWRKNVSELSISSLIGSGMSNMMFVGIFSVMRPFRYTVDNSYFVLFGGMMVLLIALFFFYKSGRALRRNEGLVLFLIYVLFIFLQIVFEEPVMGI